MAESLFYNRLIVKVFVPFQKEKEMTDLNQCCTIASSLTVSHFYIQVVKSTMEFIRLEGEIENKSKLALLTMKLDGKTIKLSGFPESLKVRAAETKVAFPVRHDWDSYFRDAKNMNELRPGERPDTIHLKDLPTRWFAERSDKEGQGYGGYVVVLICQQQFGVETTTMAVIH